MFLRKFNKKAESGIEDVAKWLLYLAIIAAASFAIIKAVVKFA